MSNVRTEYNPVAQTQSQGGENALQGDKRGNLMVTAVIRRRVAVTSPADADLADGPADAIWVSQDADVSLRLEGETANKVEPLKAGVVYPFAVTRVVSVSAGQATVGWYNRLS